MPKDSRNPWNKINLDDYENHMKLDSVQQLQQLNQMMKRQWDTYPVETAMLLGVAGGNGLEHVDGKKYKKVYGVDINGDYLAECAKRYTDIKQIMEYCCVDLTDENARLPHAELVLADLLIEYIGYDCFTDNIRKIEPAYVSCIIQINEGESFVSDSPYLHVFDDLDQVHSQMEEVGLTSAMNKIGYHLLHQEEQKLPNGKKLVRMDYRDINRAK